MDAGKFCDRAVEKILSIAVNNFGYLRDHPKQLAWVMMNYSLVHRVGRIAYDACWDNPKYPILDAGDQMSKEDGNLLYDAWGVTVSNDIAFPDPAREPLARKLCKPNKTLDEWIDIKTDPNYRYSSLYPNERKVIDFLLCTIGTGMNWNKDGFITHTGPSGVDEDIYAGYTLAEPDVPKKISAPINKILNHKILKKHVEDFVRKVEINWSGNAAEKAILNHGWKAERGLEGDPALLAEIREAFRFVAYFERLIMAAKDWNEQQWKDARKKSTWEYKGHVINISDVTADFLTSTYKLEMGINLREKSLASGDDLRAASGILGARKRAWSNFVYDTDEQKYSDLYAKAITGDEQAAQELDKICGVPKPGWDSVRFLVEDETRQYKNLEEFCNSKNTENVIPSGTYYPLSKYSNLVRMPDNAHQSYVDAGIKVAQEIVSNKDERPESRKYAREFLKRFKPV